MFGRLSQLRVIEGAAEEVMNERVLRLEDRVALELAAPVAVLVLDREEVVSRRGDRLFDVGPSRAQVEGAL